MNILLTGGAGYIGSHAAVVLTQAGHNVTIFDNFCNSHHSVIDALNKITGKKLTMVEGDIRDTDLMDLALADNKIEAVMHFAGLKSAAESVEKPALYFDNNVGGTLSLIKAMQKNNIKIFVYSSSATVYGEPQYLPIDEEHPLKPTNPYGETKLKIEQMLSQLNNDEKDWRIICLRYFNPAGAHSSGLIGESPKGNPNNLMPSILRVALGELPYLKVFGDDFATSDGTGVRDYIHVTDLADGHLKALNYAIKHKGCSFFNLGTGQGCSVLGLVQQFEKATGYHIPYHVEPRRPGDVAICFAEVERAASQLNFHAKRCDVKDLCQSALLFYKARHAP